MIRCRLVIGTKRLDGDAGTDRGHEGPRRSRIDGFAFVMLAVFGSVVLHPWLGPLFDGPAVQTWFSGSYR